MHSNNRVLPNHVDKGGPLALIRWGEFDIHHMLQRMYNVCKDENNEISPQSCHKTLFPTFDK